VDATAGIVEGASDTETDDDATTQDNRADVSVAASTPTPRRLRDLPVRRRAAANAVPRSQPVASTSQSQSTICPVCRHCLCCTCLLTLNATATGCAVHVALSAELKFRTAFVSTSRRNSDGLCDLE